NASWTAVRSGRGTRYQADQACERRPDHLPGWCLGFRAPARPAQLWGCRRERLPPGTDRGHLMEIMPGFTLTDIETAAAQIRLRQGGNGAPLLLRHGTPLTHVSWHAGAPRLAERFHVVAADLRGYGDSSAPPEEPDSSNYSFRAMAQDQVEVMQALGYDRFYVAGHDRGGRTVHRMCLDYPERVTKAGIIDIVPTLDMWAAMNKEAAISGWHWPLMAQPADFPERMLSGVDPDWFMRKKLLKLTANLNHIPPEIWNEYVRCFNEKTIRGSCGDYRAAA